VAKHSVKYQSKYAYKGRRFLVVRFNLGVGTALFEHYLGTLLDFNLLGLKPPALADDFDFQYVDLCAISRMRVYDFSRLHPAALTHLLQYVVV
jgi:hypothetical protein